MLKYTDAKLHNFTTRAKQKYTITAVHIHGIQTDITRARKHIHRYTETQTHKFIFIPTSILTAIHQNQHTDTQKTETTIHTSWQTYRQKERHTNTWTLKHTNDHIKTLNARALHAQKHELTNIQTPTNPQPTKLTSTQAHLNTHNNIQTHKYINTKKN